MLALIRMFLCLAETKQLAEAYLETGGEVAILAMCDRIEEMDDTTYHVVARHLRDTLTQGEK